MTLARGNESRTAGWALRRMMRESDGPDRRPYAVRIGFACNPRRRNEIPEIPKTA